MRGELAVDAQRRGERDQKVVLFLVVQINGEACGGEQLHSLLLRLDLGRQILGRSRIVQQSLQDKQLTPMQIVEQLYITCLTRKPTEQEVASLSPLFAEGTDVNRSLDDVYWALLNSREFLFNH